MSVDILCRVVGTGAGSTGFSDIDAAPVGAAITNARSVGSTSQPTRSTPKANPQAAWKSRTRFIKLTPVLLLALVVTQAPASTSAAPIRPAGLRFSSSRNPDECQATKNRLVNHGHGWANPVLKPAARLNQNRESGREAGLFILKPLETKLIREIEMSKASNKPVDFKEPSERLVELVCESSSQRLPGNTRRLPPT